MTRRRHTPEQIIRMNRPGFDGDSAVPRTVQSDAAHAAGAAPKRRRRVGAQRLQPREVQGLLGYASPATSLEHAAHLEVNEVRETLTLPVCAARV